LLIDGRLASTLSVGASGLIFDAKIKNSVIFYVLPR